MSNYVTKIVIDECLNCGERQNFDAVYRSGKLVELVCHGCEVVDFFGYDDED